MWNWTQPNGIFKDITFQWLFLQLDVQGLIELLPQREDFPYFYFNVKSLVVVDVDQKPIIDRSPEFFN